MAHDGMAGQAASVPCGTARSRVGLPHAAFGGYSAAHTQHDKAEPNRVFRHPNVVPAYARCRPRPSVAVRVTPVHPASPQTYTLFPLPLSILHRCLFPRFLHPQNTYVTVPSSASRLPRKHYERPCKRRCAFSILNPPSYIPAPPTNHHYRPRFRPQSKRGRRSTPSASSSGRAWCPSVARPSSCKSGTRRGRSGSGL